MVDYTQFKVKEAVAVSKNRDRQNNFNFRRFFFLHKKIILFLMAILFFLFLLVIFFTKQPAKINLNSENIISILEKKYPEYTPFQRIKKQKDERVVICEDPVINKEENQEQKENQNIIEE